MKLGDYLKQHKKTIPQAADEIGVSVETVRYWIKGKRRPWPEAMEEIFRWSAGAVEPNDFYVLKEEARANGPDPQPASQEAAA